jgi:hypothetical protein
VAASQNGQQASLKKQARYGPDFPSLLIEKTSNIEVVNSVVKFFFQGFYSLMHLLLSAYVISQVK